MHISVSTVDLCSFLLIYNMHTVQLPGTPVQVQFMHLEFGVSESARNV